MQGRLSPIVNNKIQFLPLQFLLRLITLLSLSIHTLLAEKGDANTVLLTSAIYSGLSVHVLFLHIWKMNWPWASNWQFIIPERPSVNKLNNKIYFNIFILIYLYILNYPQ